MQVAIACWAARHNLNMSLCFVLLLLALCAVWLPAPAGRWRAGVPLWAVLYGTAVVAALVQGVVTPLGCLVLLLLAALGLAAARSVAPSDLRWLRLALLALAAALTAHQVPGFHNPVAIDALRLSPDTRPFTQYLNFDKGSVGLVLLGCLALRQRPAHAPAAPLLRTTACIWAATTCVVLGLAWALGVVRPDAKWPPQAVLFLSVNLFLTCMAEQALFRTLVQEPLRRTRAGPWGAVLLSATLFGLVHAGGGAPMVLLAGLAGLGHAVAYERTGRIGAAIAVHFGLNAVHFVAFSYPALGA